MCIRDRSYSHHDPNPANDPTHQKHPRLQFPNNSRLSVFPSYDRNLGGLEMTLRLRDHLVKVFNSQKKRTTKLEDNPRAMAKLLKEAERVKKVLSANSDHKAQVGADDPVGRMW